MISRLSQTVIYKPFYACLCQYALISVSSSAPSILPIYSTGDLSLHICQTLFETGTTEL